MISYQVYSEKLQCEVLFKYSVIGNLIGLEILEDKEHQLDPLMAFLSNMPLTQKILKDRCAKFNITLVELKPDLSFEKFWNTYNYKDGASKKKTEAIWNRMSVKDRSQAINFIPKYERILTRTGVSKMYATTYLNEKRWENYK